MVLRSLEQSGAYSPVAHSCCYRFVPSRYFDAMGVNVKLEERFSPPHPYSVAEAPGTWDVRGKRGTTLGLNV